MWFRRLPSDQDSGNPYMLSMVLGFLTFLALDWDIPRNIDFFGRRVVIGRPFFLRDIRPEFGRNGLWLEHPAVNRIIYFLSLAVAVVSC